MDTARLYGQSIISAFGDPHTAFDKADQDGNGELTLKEIELFSVAFGAPLASGRIHMTDDTSLLTAMAWIHTTAKYDHAVS